MFCYLHKRSFCILFIRVFCVGLLYGCVGYLYCPSTRGSIAGLVDSPGWLVGYIHLTIHTTQFVYLYYSKCLLGSVFIARVNMKDGLQGLVYIFKIKYSYLYQVFVPCLMLT